MSTYYELNPDKDELSCDICGSTDMESCRICKKCCNNPKVILNEEKGCYEFIPEPPIIPPPTLQQVLRIVLEEWNNYKRGTPPN